ncbi:ABC transporter permease [candidate division KSB1 bacterium]|nr:ABC transporter permease [candidate division KSB1 bacterium]
MFKNYLKMTFRNLKKYKQYSLINILGLAIGLACFVLIVLWVQDELSYDRFHQNADDIYILYRNDKNKLDASTSRLLASALKAELPEVVNATSFTPLPEPFKAYVEYQNRGFEENIAMAEPEFFDLFSFEFKEGDPRSALQNPNSLIITERMAQKYFGEKNALGESMVLTLIGQKKILKVTGILKNLPHNSHIRRDFFAPIEFLKTLGIDWDAWYSQTVNTYIQTQGEIDASQLAKKILECKQRYYNEENLSYGLVPLTRIHLHANNIAFFTATGDIKYVYIFSAIAGIILLIACMNYMNLSNALALKRTREIGIHKVVGARRFHLLSQYLGETLILTLLALGCALLFVELLLPMLNQISGKFLSMSFLNPKFILILLLTTLATAGISGLYPALFMSAFQPIQVLKGRFFIHENGMNLKKGLILFQFSLSIVIIISTIIVLNQMNFIRDANLGYDKENILCLKVKGDVSGQYAAFKNKLLENPDVLTVSRSEPLDANELGETEDVFWQGKNEKFKSWVLHVDFDFADAYKIDMESGRFYSDQFPTDPTSAFVLNKAAVKEMGLESPLGQELTVWGRQGKIIGLVNDFHFHSLHHAIEPMILRMPNPEEESIYYRNIAVRSNAYSVPQSLAMIEETWKSFFPSEPFDYYFVDENLNLNYLAEQRMSKIFKTFSFIAIFIACLGLYGLTAFTIEGKFKDIGVHKVLGASVSNIVTLISKSYLWLIILSNVLAWPITYFAMNKWLQNFAYRTHMGWWMYIIAGILVLVIALLTISWQAIRAATANPVESLRYE